MLPICVGMNQHCHHAIVDLLVEQFDRDVLEPMRFARAVAGGVVHDRVQCTGVVDGVRKVVTHMSKKTRGEIARALLQSRSVPKTPEDLYAIVSEKYPCALTPSDGVNPWVLEVIAV